jgi:hypothetical protein
MTEPRSSRWKTPVQRCRPTRSPACSHAGPPASPHYGQPNQRPGSNLHTHVRGIGTRQRGGHNQARTTMVRIWSARAAHLAWEQDLAGHLDPNRPCQPGISRSHSPCGELPMSHVDQSANSVVRSLVSVSAAAASGIAPERNARWPPACSSANPSATRRSRSCRRACQPRVDQPGNRVLDRRDQGVAPGKHLLGVGGVDREAVQPEDGLCPFHLLQERCRQPAHYGQPRGSASVKGCNCG